MMPTGSEGQKRSAGGVSSAVRETYPWRDRKLAFF
jgi:hypothetical protein